jgi:hypothetical protein
VIDQLPTGVDMGDWFSLCCALPLQDLIAVHYTINVASHPSFKPQLIVCI